MITEREQREIDETIKHLSHPSKLDLSLEPDNPFIKFMKDQYHYESTRESKHPQFVSRYHFNHFHLQDMLNYYFDPYEKEDFYFIVDEHSGRQIHIKKNRALGYLYTANEDLIRSRFSKGFYEDFECDPEFTKIFRLMEEGISPYEVIESLCVNFRHLKTLWENDLKNSPVKMIIPKDKYKSHIKHNFPNR